MSRSDNVIELRRIVAPLRTSRAVKAVKIGQAIILAGMKKRCPVGPTHKLSRSIHATKVGVGSHSVGGAVVVGTAHALAVEFGTAHNRAHPFVRPTAAIDGPRAEAAMARELNG